jgi:hypothetical protein
VARFLAVAGAVGRVAFRLAGKNRFLRAGYTAAQTTFRSMGRVLHLLFLQITGLFFCLFALGFAARIPRSYHEYLTQGHGLQRTGLLAALTLLFAWFGITSFWRSRVR